MKKAPETEWMELRSLVASLLIYFSVLIAIVAAVPLSYLLPIEVIVAGYILICLTLGIAVIMLEHRSQHEGDAPSSSPSLPLKPSHRNPKYHRHDCPAA